MVMVVFVPAHVVSSVMVVKKMMTKFFLPAALQWLVPSLPIKMCVCQCLIVWQCRCNSHKICFILI